MICLIFVGHECPTIKDLALYVVPLYAADWREIGLALGLSNALLRIIKADHPISVRDCCTAIFKEWLQRSNDPSWEMVLNAINSLSVSNGMYINLYAIF